MLKKVFANTSWLIAEKLVRSVMTLFVGALVIRFLGPAEYGKIAYALAFIGIFHGVSTLGIEGVLVRELVAIREKTSASSNEALTEQSQLISSVFLARLMSGVTLLVISAMLVATIPNSSPEMWIITLFIGIVLLAQSADSIDLFNQSELKSKRTAIAKIISYLCSNSIRVALIHFEAGVLYFALTYAIEAALTAVILLLNYARGARFVLDLGYFRRKVPILLKETWPIIIAALATALAVRLDQILLSSQLGAQALGIYSAAIVYATATFFVPAVICNSLLPMATNAKLTSYSKYTQVLRWGYLLNLSIALVVIALTWILSDTIVAIMYGGQFAEAAEVLRIYALLNLPVYIGITHVLWIINEHKVMYLLYRAIAGASLTILLCLILIPRFGVLGAAISVLISQVISEVLIPVALNQKLFLNIILPWRFRSNV